MAKKGKMAGDGRSKRVNSALKTGTFGSIREDLNFLFETQELKKKKGKKRSSISKSRSKKRDSSSVKQRNTRASKENSFTASETLSKKIREKIRELPEPEDSDNEEEQHIVNRTRRVPKPSASKRAVVSRARQLKRFTMPASSSASSSVTSQSQGSASVTGSSLRSRSCSSASSLLSAVSGSSKARSKPCCQAITATEPSTSGQISRPTFKRRNSPHPRLLQAKRTKTNKNRKSRSSSSASSASQKSSSKRRQARRNLSRSNKCSVVATRANRSRVTKRGK